MFFENYKKYAGDLIFQSEVAKLRELLHVKPKYKTVDNDRAIEAICNYIISITLSQTKRSMYDMC